MENRYDLFIPEKTQLRFFKNVMGVHKYSVKQNVRAEFGVLPLAIFGLQASTNFWVHLLNLQEDSLAYQSYKDSMNFPKGFAQKFEIFFCIILAFLIYGIIRTHFLKSDYYMQ